MTANAPKLDVFWSPTQRDKYVAFGSDISLFRLNPPEPIQTEWQPDLPFVPGSQLNQITECQFPKCISLCPEPSKDYLVAIGQHQGDVLISSWDQRKPDPLIGAELKSHTKRQCLAVAWGPKIENGNAPLIAAGLDKSRSDPSLLIWDLNSPRKQLTALPSDQSITSHTYHKPIYEYGKQEVTNSVAWFNNNELVAGMNKYLRIIDLRESPGSYKHTTNTKAVYGVCVDLQCENHKRVASFVENQISIWDIRNMDKPLINIQSQKNSIIKIAWSPLRAGTIASITKESSCVKIYDIQHYPSNGGDDSEHNLNQRIVSVDTGDVTGLASFDWSPHDENRLLLINNSGLVSDHIIYERRAVDIGVVGEICFSDVKKFGLFRDGDIDGISYQMKRRAECKYALNRSLTSTVELCGKDKSLKALWNWVCRMNELSREDNFSQHMIGGGSRLIGMSKILESAGKSKAEPIQWIGVERLTTNITQYHSKERDMCLRICEWPTGLDKLRPVTQTLEKLGKFEKAATLAVLYGQISDALDILNRGAQPKDESDQPEGVNLSIIAMAIAGVSSGSRNTLWLSKCRELHRQISNPYLRACFSFLTCEEGNLDQLLETTEVTTSLTVLDRVAFACIYLSDHKLREFIVSLQDKVIAAGDLSGISVTGLSSAGIELLEQYVDRTYDAQTACLLSIHSLPNINFLHSSLPQHWIKNYRELLDKWKMWTERAEFDIFYKECDSDSTALNTNLSDLQLCCNYCNKPVTPNPIQQRKLYSNTANKGFKTLICYECRKPLPRCVLCLKNMGTASGVFGAREDLKASHLANESAPLSPFDCWFTWCQTCQHGGHAIHIEQWFNSNTECPVSDCTCNCMYRDNLPHT